MGATVRVHLGFDHAGHELAQALVRRFAATDLEVVPHGSHLRDDGDDYPQYCLAAAVAAVQDQDRGVDAFAALIAASATGAVITANKVRGARAVLFTDPASTASARRVDDANVLVLPAGIGADAAEDAVRGFVSEPFGSGADDVRRALQTLEFESAGTIGGWQLDYGEATYRTAAADGYDPAGPRAVVYETTGAPDVLHIVRGTEGRPGRGEVRVRVKAAGLNPFDAKVRRGVIPVDHLPPYGVGQDFAGVVEVVGPAAAYADGAPVSVGDPVLGWCVQPASGAVREQLVVPAEQLARKPAALSWDLAGALQTVALTAQASLDTLQIDEKDVVLVSAAAGGVGLVFSQLAVRAGAVVIGTASAANHDFLRGLGIVPVTYGEGLAERVSLAAAGLGGRGVTAVQDNHGREAVDAGLVLGVPAERIVTIADHAATRELGLASPGRYRRDSGTLEALAALAARGELAVPVQVYPLAAVTKAYDRLEGGHVRGKLAIRF